MHYDMKIRVVVLDTTQDSGEEGKLPASNNKLTVIQVSSSSFKLPPNQNTSDH